MFEYLLIGQQMQQPAQPQQPQAQPPAQQQAQQQSQQPAAPAQPAVPGAQPAPAGDVSMGTLLMWAGIGGALSGVVQAIFNLSLNVVDILMTIGIAAVLGILVAIIIGQFGSKIPLKAGLMVKAAAFMFVINLIVGFFFTLGSGAAMMTGIVGIGAGAFAYGWLLQKKIPGIA